MKAAEAKMGNSFTYRTTKEVLQSFFREDIAKVLTDDSRLFIDKTFDLIQCLMRLQAKRSFEHVKANFDILGLVTDDIENDDNHLFLGVLASQLDPDC